MKDWFKRTEKILYSHQEMKARLAYINDSLNRLEPKVTAKYGTSPGGGGGNQGEPERLAAKRADLERKKEEAERSIMAVESVYRILDDEERGIFDYKYCRKWGNAQVYDMAVPMSRAKFYRTRFNIVKKAAKIWGYLPVDKVRLL